MFDDQKYCKFLINRKRKALKTEHRTIVGPFYFGFDTGLHRSPRSSGIPEPKKKGRQTYDRTQTNALEERFRQNKYVTKNQRAELFEQTKLSDRQIKIWSVEMGVVGVWLWEGDAECCEVMPLNLRK